jgi:multicomponent K+:H+ antiporter subunit A
LHLQRLGVVGRLVPVAAVLGAMFSVAYSLRFVHDVFFGTGPRDVDRTPHEPPRWMKIPVEVLVALCVLVGMVPHAVVGPTLRMAAQGVLHGTLPDYSLAVWHGFNVPLGMSLVATMAGVILYFGLHRRYDIHSLDLTGTWTGHRIYHDLVRLVSGAGRSFSALTADGRLQRQVAVLLSVAILAGWLPFATPLPARELAACTSMTAIAVILWIVLAVATVMTVAMHRQRLTALVLTGAVGLVVSATFVYLSAPDLALTQLSVEVATVLLMLMALPFLPAATPLESSTRRRLRDALLAVGSGTGAGVAAWWMMTSSGPTVSTEHVARSAPEGGGTNVVNVILVDFRGFDTYGEITVLAIAALGIVAMLAGSGADGSRAPGRAPADAFRPVMLALLSRVLLPLALLLSVYIFLRGHNLPGGGFIAGLVTGVAVALLSVGNGSPWTAARITADFHRLLGSGLAIAGATGIGAWLFGRPFLTSAHGHVHLPLVGDLHWATAALFDLGVYLTVVATVILVLERLAQLRPVIPGRA